jgi:hypothetical protein
MEGYARSWWCARGCAAAAMLLRLRTEVCC